jgi:hypothetical protein
MNINKTELNLELNDFNSLPLGKIYIVKSPSDIFIWELKVLSHVNFLTSISTEALLYTIKYPDLFSSSEENYIITYTSHLKLPKDIDISLRTRLFIWVPTVNCQSYTSSQVKLFDEYKHEPYSILDLTTLCYKNSPYFTNLANLCLAQLNSKEHISIPITLEEYQQHPIKLNYLLNHPTLLVNNPIVKDLISITDLIANLAISSPDYTIIKKLQQFPKTTLNHLIINPKLKFTLLYKIIKGIYQKKVGQFTIDTLNCPSLWLWFELLITRLPKSYYAYPEYIIKLFFSWIYMCNTIYSNRTGKGFHTYIRYKKITYTFEPSVEAIKSFYRLF